MPTSRTCCVDASIVIRLLVSRDDQPVRALWDAWQQEGVTLVSPTLLLYEVTNALYQQQRQNNLSANIVSLMIRTAHALPIKLWSDEGLHSAAHHMATELGLPATCDAHYLVTAERNAAAFWTSDKKLVDKVGGKLDWVHYLPRELEPGQATAT